MPTMRKMNGECMKFTTKKLQVGIFISNLCCIIVLIKYNGMIVIFRCTSNFISHCDIDLRFNTIYTLHYDLYVSKSLHIRIRTIYQLQTRYHIHKYLKWFLHIICNNFFVRVYLLWE